MGFYCVHFMSIFFNEACVSQYLPKRVGQLVQIQRDITPAQDKGDAGLFSAGSALKDILEFSM